MQIPEKYRAGEGTRLEFKLKLPSEDKKVLKTIVAFANGEGGSVIFGVDDSTHEVVGVTSENVAQLMDSLTDMICDACEPLIVPEIALRTFDGKTIIQVDVPAGNHTPYYLKKEGPLKGVYVRVGATTRNADDEVLQELQLAGARRTYDGIVERASAPVTEEEISLFAEEVRKRRLESTLPVKAEQLLGWELIQENGGQYYPTVAFRLMTRADLHFSGIQCALFRGTTKVHFVDRKEIAGTVQQQIDEAVNFLIRNLRVGARIKGIYREDLYEIPPDALRETVTNAVMHRNYLAHAFIQISVYDDRVEVFSPGKLFGRQTLEKMLRGASYLRNPVLAGAFQRLNLVERWGTGIQRVHDLCLENGLEPPEYVCDDIGVTVTYRRLPADADRKPKKPKAATDSCTPAQEKLLAFISEEGKVSVAMVMAHMACSRSTAMRHIGALLAQNLICKQGEHKSVRYVSKD